MTNITRREWMKHIKGILTEAAALIMALLDDWDGMTNDDRQEAVERIKGKVDTILTMVIGRSVF